MAMIANKPVGIRVPYIEEETGIDSARLASPSPFKTNENLLDEYGSRARALTSIEAFDV